MNINEEQSNYYVHTIPPISEFISIEDTEIGIIKAHIPINLSLDNVQLPNIVTMDNIPTNMFPCTDSTIISNDIKYNIIMANKDYLIIETQLKPINMTTNVSTDMTTNVSTNMTTTISTNILTNAVTNNRVISSINATLTTIDANNATLTINNTVTTTNDAITTTNDAITTSNDIVTTTSNDGITTTNDTVITNNDTVTTTNDTVTTSNDTVTTTNGITNYITENMTQNMTNHTIKKTNTYSLSFNDKITMPLKRIINLDEDILLCHDVSTTYILVEKFLKLYNQLYTYNYADHIWVVKNTITNIIYYIKIFHYYSLLNPNSVISVSNNRNISDIFKTTLEKIMKFLIEK